MNKRLLISLFCGLFALLNQISAQRYTYYYVQTDWYDNNGVKYRGSGNTYFTFYGNICYESDANGNTKSQIVWKLNSQQNGYRVYKVNLDRTYDFAQGLHGVLYGNWHLAVTNDYSVINEKMGDITYVYKRQAPSTQQGPKMYMPSK